MAVCGATVALAAVLLMSLAPSWAQRPGRDAAPAPAPEQDARDWLELGRGAQQKRFEMEKQISKELTDWNVEKEILESRIEFVQAQIKDLKMKTEEGQGDITEADKERSELLASDEALEKVKEIELEAAEAYEKQIRDLIARLPTVLVAKLQPLIDRLPEPGKDPTTIKLSVSQRFQNILGILNEVNRFARDVTVVSERREVADGRDAEVKTMYIGLAQAYYAGAGETAEFAGIGTPSAEGWQWQRSPEDAQAIGLLIRMHEGGEPADFVPAPVRLK